MTDTPAGLPTSALLAILQPWVGVAEPIHQAIARFIDHEPEHETLWVGCGSGRSVLWWAERFQTPIAGVDPDAKAIESAEASAREMGLSDLVTLQASDADNLPHEGDVFDMTIINTMYLRDADARVVLEQVAQVARPMSTVVALVPTWLSTPRDVDARRIAALGLVPHLLVKWKGFMRAAGFVELGVEDATRDGRWIAEGWLWLLVRAWRVARWRGLRAVLGRDVRTLRKLARARVLGLSIVKGTRWPHG